MLTYAAVTAPHSTQHSTQSTELLTWSTLRLGSPPLRYLSPQRLHSTGLSAGPLRQVGSACSACVLWQWSQGPFMLPCCFLLDGCFLNCGCFLPLGFLPLPLMPPLP